MSQQEEIQIPTKCVMCDTVIPDEQLDIQYDEDTGQYIGQPLCSESCNNRYNQCAGFDGN